MAGALLAFAVTFIYRWLTLDFVNDHFVHVSRARQILAGDVPVRDFFDPGLILQYYASAAALHLSGGTLFGEALLTVSFVSLGAALAFLLAVRVSESRIIAVVTTAIAVVTFPRLYSYPKVFLFVLALTCAWRYASLSAETPSRRSLVRSRSWLMVMAVVTAMAFLFRHDHGLYIGVAMTVFLGVLHSKGRNRATLRRWARATGTYVGVTVLLLLPFFVFIQSEAGIWTYVTGSTPQQQAITTLRLNAIPWRVDWSAPLFDVNPRTERRIYVRWSQDADEETRRDREARYGLSRPLPQEGTTWSYVIVNDDPANIRQLFSDPLVADTHGLDRREARLVEESIFQRLQRFVPMLRWRIAPGILNSDNAIAWLYYATLLLPFVGGIMVLRAGLPREQTASITALILLCGIIGQSLVRESPESRLPDIATPMAVLGAWITSRWLRPDVQWRRLRLTAAVIVSLITFWGAATLGMFGERLNASGILAGPFATVERFRTVNAELHMRPIEAWAGTESTGLRGLTRYVMDCTMPTDRLMVAWFEPQVFFYAERPFAGGQTYFDRGWHASEADQQLTIQRLTNQRVPIVLTNATADQSFKANFPLVFEYVQRHYTVAARSTFGSNREYGILVHRDISPKGTYEPLGLPCYR